VRVLPGRMCWSVSISSAASRGLSRCWTTWAAAAVLTLAQMDAVWDDADSAGSVGARDALALVLVDAVRNTYAEPCTSLASGTQR
jgi:hypothetical protein